MAGIQIHSSSPINTNASNSKETTEAPTSTQNVPASAPASTTAYAMNSAQSAQPGAPAMPAPTGAAIAYKPPSPTRTTAIPGSTNPPPPQPGQVPQPIQERGSTMPAPPQPITVPTSYPPPPVSQLWTPSAYAQPPAGVTSSDLSHPPGYVQNSHASFDDRDLEPENKTHSSSPTRGGGILGGGPLRAEEESPIWDTAMTWAKEAGRKLSHVEEEIWKKVGGK